MRSVTWQAGSRSKDNIGPQRPGYEFSISFKHNGQPLEVLDEPVTIQLALLKAHLSVTSRKGYK